MVYQRATWKAVSIKHCFHSVAAAYSIPKSTLADYASGKVKIGSKQLRATVLTTTEGQKLVEYCLHTASIGYGQTGEQVCLTVKKIVDTNRRPNPFEDNKQWRELFKK